MKYFNQKTYEESLSSITEVFSKALDSTNQLMNQIYNEIVANNEKISSIEKRNGEIQITYDKAKKFSEKINNLLN